MLHDDIFRLETGPYIPDEHAKYDLLPSRRRKGGEVFSYPAELDAIDNLVSERLDGDKEENRSMRLIPYGKKSYAEYFGMLEEYASRFREEDPELAQLIDWLIAATKRMNIKEGWSVVRYVGSEHDEDPLADASGLTKGRCYYWPCSRENPVYEGVIDNEEFTSYLYPCDPGSWEIVADPTGMAARALAGEADTVSSWKLELAQEDGPLDAWALEEGVSAKRARNTSAFDETLDSGWSESESDPVNIRCPGCGISFAHEAWTLVNARLNPELAERLMEGTLFEFECPSCGYTANVAHPCLYLDPAHRACAYLVANDAMAQGVTEMFDGLNREDTPIGRSTKRIVRDRHGLRGVAIAWNEGLDDRVIELLKLGISGSAKMQGAIPTDSECRVDFEGTENNSLVFHLETDDGTGLKSLLPKDAHEAFARDLSSSSMACDQPYVVDREWAGCAIDAIQAGSI